MLPFVAVAVVVLAAPAEREKPLREAVWGAHFVAGTQAYEDLAQRRQDLSPQAAYLAGFAFWKMHQPEKAEPLIQKAVEGKFKAGGNRIQPDELLAHIAAYNEAKPKRVLVKGLDATLIEPYADEQSDTTQPFLEALPAFTRIGRDIFGSPPPVRFFLLAKTPALRRLYDAMEIKGDRSTGITNLIVVCAEKAHRPTEQETVSMALHEATHAWQWTYLQRKYDRPIKVPAYVDEGLAVYVASLWSNDLTPLARKRLQRWHDTGKPAPEFERVKAFGDFHASDTSHANYLTAGMLMERLLGPPDSGAKKIPAVLDAFAETEDDAEAWRKVTGKDVRKEFDALVAEVWKKDP